MRCLAEWQGCQHGLGSAKHESGSFWRGRGRSHRREIVANSSYQIAERFSASKSNVWNCSS